MDIKEICTINNEPYLKIIIDTERSSPWVTLHCFKCDLYHKKDVINISHICPCDILHWGYFKRLGEGL